VIVALAAGSEAACTFAPLQPVSVANAASDSRPKQILIFITVHPQTAT